MRPPALALLALLALPAAVPGRAATPTSAPAAPPPATTGPCADLIEAVRPGSTEPEPLLAAAACLRAAEADRAERAPAARARGDTAAAADPALDSSRARLRLRLPAAETWYASRLERLRARRDLPHLRDMAWLAALRDPQDPGIWREIAESHALDGDVVRAGLALLRQAERDSTQSGYIQYQIEGQLRSHAEHPAPMMLDSMILRFRHRKAVTAEILESVCWANRHYPGAYVNTMAWLALRRPPPEAFLERATRYQSAGYFDFAADLLEAGRWRSFPAPWRARGRAVFLRVRFQLEDWQAIAAETAAGGDGLAAEERYIAAAAALNLGRARDALGRLEGVPGPGGAGGESPGGESPWSYRAELLRARALLALGRLPEASRTLDALKRSPRRREGTGPILFWQGWLALQQGNAAAAESLLVLASAYTGDAESQRALEYREYLLLDSGAARADFLRGLPESPLESGERLRALDRVPASSPLWPHARLEKAQILAARGHADSARAVLDHASRNSPDRVLALKAEALAAFLQEKAPGGRPAALARYEDLLIEYQQGVIPEFSRGRIRALK